MASAWREPGRAPGAGLPSRRCVMAAAPLSSRTVSSASLRQVCVRGTGSCVIN